jgi:hypothetical protein
MNLQKNKLGLHKKVAAIGGRHILVIKQQTAKIKSMMAKHKEHAEVHQIKF